MEDVADGNLVSNDDNFDNSDEWEVEVEQSPYGSIKGDVR
jgi:hypothetical protein